MLKKTTLKVGLTVKVTTGQHRNSISVIKKIDRKKEVLFLESISRTISALDKRRQKRYAKEVYTPIHVSNVELVKN